MGLVSFQSDHCGGTMTLDFAHTRMLLDQLRTAGHEFFDSTMHLEDESYAYDNHEADHYWSKLNDTVQETSLKLQSNLIRVTKTIANSMKHSTLLSEADRKDLGTWTKSVRASLRLRRYEAWDTEVLHDEGVVLGVQPAGQSDTTPVDPAQAFRSFERGITNLMGLVDLLDVSPILSTDEWRANPQATAEYEPDTAFVMMQIDPRKPELEDTYNAIKECFSQFGIEAVRADDIEHEEVITRKITERIRVSEFLIADLTGARPSVYYEIGYAHALNRKVIMYRSSGAELHFDLAAYNCPEYSNLTDLKNQLMRRLEQVTNRRPKSASR